MKRMKYGKQSESEEEVADLMQRLREHVEGRQKAVREAREHELEIIELLFNAPQGVQHRYMRVDWNKMRQDKERGRL
jgi:hypothetical protein